MTASRQQVVSDTEQPVACGLAQPVPCQAHWHYGRAQRSRGHSQVRVEAQRRSTQATRGQGLDAEAVCMSTGDRKPVHGGN